MILFARAPEDLAVIMLRNQESERNIEDLADEEISSAIHHLDLEEHFESNRKRLMVMASRLQSSPYFSCSV